MDGLFDNFISSDGKPAYSLFFIMIDFDHSINIDHKMVDINVDDDWFAFNIKGVAIFFHSNKLLVFIRINLKIVKVVFFCSGMLFEKDIIRVRISTFFEKVLKNATVLKIHPMRTSFMDLVIISLKTTILKFVFFHSLYIFPGMIVTFIGGVMPTNLY